MRLIQVVPSIAHRSSGPTYTTTRLCEQLIMLGHDVTLACTDFPDEVTAGPWITLCGRVSLSGKLRISPAMSRWLRHCLSSEPPAVLHSNSLWQMPSYYCAQVARRSGVPHLVSPRGTLASAAFAAGSPGKRLLWPLWQRRALREAICFHATAESEVQEIRRFGFGQPIAMIPNGVDVPARETTEGKRLREVLFLSRVHPTKGVDVLLNAWRGVQGEFPGWQLRIVGPSADSYAAKMRELCTQLGAKRVEFAGELLGAEREAAFLRAALFVLPTRHENFGVAIAEALAHATPAIVSKHAPWAGLATHGCGWWIDFGVEPLRVALRDALTTPLATLAQMGQHGRRWMADSFAWSSVGSKMEELYRWIARGQCASESPSMVRLAASERRNCQGTPQRLPNALS
jgi:glycosyltransferase involved in cell wall biosynthesis